MMRVPVPGDASLVWLIVAVLASWRITCFICYEAGPFEVGTRLRRGLAAVGLARLVTCFHCTGAWVSLAVILLVYEWGWRTLLLAIATAGATSVLERWLGVGQFSSGSDA
jgi:hypothetical protein